MLLDPKPDIPDATPDATPEKAKKAPREISRREVREAAMVIILSALTLELPAAECLHGITSMLPGARQQRALQDALAQDIVRTFDLQRGKIESDIVEYAARPLTHLTMMERAIISGALAEMHVCPSTPRKVVINESIELAKRFGAEGGNNLVNGVLDAAAKAQQG